MREGRHARRLHARVWVVGRDMIGAQGVDQVEEDVVGAMLLVGGRLAWRDDGRRVDGHGATPRAEVEARDLARQGPEVEVEGRTVGRRGHVPYGHLVPPVPRRHHVEPACALGLAPKVGRGGNDHGEPEGEARRDREVVVARCQVVGRGRPVGEGPVRGRPDGEPVDRQPGTTTARHGPRPLGAQQ